MRRTLALAAALLVPGLASAQSGPAWVWANNPSAGQYTPSATYAHHPAGGSITVRRTGTGSYQATFAGMKDVASGGNVQVSSYGGGPAHCKVERWVPSASDLQVTVRCFEGEAPADAMFALLFVPPPPTGAPLRFVWAGQARTASYTAPSSYAFNSGRPVQIQRMALGRYTATFPGVSRDEANGGNVQVTGYGSGPEHCKVERWVPGGEGLQVSVACFRGTAPADAPFSLLFKPAE